MVLENKKKVYHPSQVVLHCAKIVGKMNKTRTRSFIWIEYSNWMNFLTAFMKKLLTSPTIRFALLFFDKLLFDTPWFNRLANFQSCRPPQKRVNNAAKQIQKNLHFVFRLKNLRIRQSFLHGRLFFDGLFAPVAKSFWSHVETLKVCQSIESRCIQQHFS